MGATITWGIAPCPHTNFGIIVRRTYNALTTREYVASRGERTMETAQSRAMPRLVSGRGKLSRMEISYTVRRSRPGLGLGLFSRRAFEAGDFIVEYAGERIPTPLADTLKTRYLFELDEEWTINGESERNIARYINHSCEPNAEAETHNDRILISAVRPIHAGEEITIDYGDEYFDEFIRSKGCKCERCTNRELASEA